MPPAQDDDQPAFLYELFVRPYIGKAADTFYEYLKSNNEKFRGCGLERPYYAKAYNMYYRIRWLKASN
jgi:hypothetical protein